MTAVVLAVIAMGVGIVSGLAIPPPLKAYGVPPLRFEAAFPTSLVGKPQVETPQVGLALYFAGFARREIDFVVFSIDPSLLGNNGGDFLNKGGEFLIPPAPSTGAGPTTTTVSDGYRTVRVLVRCGTFKLRYVQKLTDVTLTTPVVAMTTAAVGATGPAPYRCYDSEIVSGRGAFWSVYAAAPTLQAAQEFVDSFRPFIASKSP